jgi:predicted deacylase
MQIESWPMQGDSPGTRRELAMHRYGAGMSGPVVYLQAGLHADEIPGVLVLQHLLPLLDEAEAEGRLNGEVLVVPLANPIGFGQWAMGRHELDSLRNFNRGFPDLAQMVGDVVEATLGQDETRNLRLIRKAFRQALSGLCSRTDMVDQQVALMQWSCCADYVLDLHCDHVAVMHVYTNTQRPADTALLCRALGADLALLADLSGGNAFDEAHTQPWLQLRDRFGAQYPIPQPCFAATVEYRGQFDVSDALAAEDAARLMQYLIAVGAVAGEASLGPDRAARRPLAGAAEMFAPQGGVVSWDVTVGSEVVEGQALGHVTDPVSRRRMVLQAPVSGMLFRHELWHSVLRGQSLAHVAGETILRSGDLLSD